MITNRKNIQLKKVIRCILQSESCEIECIVFPRTFAEYETILGEDDPVTMTGQVNLDESLENFPTKIEKLKQEAETRVSGVRVNGGLDKANSQKLVRLRKQF